MADKEKPMFGDPLGGWKSWVAWHPVRAWDGEWYWLKRIERRRIQLHPYLHPGAPHLWWQYRDA